MGKGKESDPIDASADSQPTYLAIVYPSSVQDASEVCW